MNINCDLMIPAYLKMVKKMPDRVKIQMVKIVENPNWIPEDDEELIKMYFFYSTIINNGYVTTENSDKYLKKIFEDIKNKGHVFGINVK